MNPSGHGYSSRSYGFSYPWSALHSVSEAAAVIQVAAVSAAAVSVAVVSVVAAQAEVGKHYVVESGRAGKTLELS